jgi:hypothetical protein
MCDHLHDTTSRYDAAEKLLTFLRVCRNCGIERIVETLQYEPKLADGWWSGAPARCPPGGILDIACHNAGRVALPDLAA